jgi:hypothetical protein
MINGKAKKVKTAACSSKRLFPSACALRLSRRFRFAPFTLCRFAVARHPNKVLRANFWKSLIAVVTGNLLYLFVLSPWLPLPARHRPNVIDLGLIVDVWVCLVIYGIIELFLRFRRNLSRKA